MDSVADSSPASGVKATSKCGQIKGFLIGKMLSGELAAGARLCSSNELARLFAVNKNTAVKALNELAAEQYIQQRRGVGSFVSQRRPRAQSRSLGVLVYNLDSPIFSKIVRGLDDCCRELAYDLISCGIYASWDKERQILNEFLVSGKVDGLVVFPANGGEEELKLLKRVNDSGIPVIVHSPPGASGDLVTMDFDYEAGIARSVEHLFSQGFRKIGLVNGTSQRAAIMQRLYGYRMGMEKVGLAFRPDYVFHVQDLEERHGFAAADRFIGHPERPDALVVVSDEVAVGLINRLHERGLSVPGDVAITAGGNTDIGTHPLYSLTTIAPDFQSMGRKLVGRLMEMIAHPEGKHENLLFTQELIIRNSSKAKGAMT